MKKTQSLLKATKRPVLVGIRYVFLSHVYLRSWLTCVYSSREDPTRIWERRAPLTPDAVHDLVKDGEVEVEVASCSRRVFVDGEYERVSWSFTLEVFVDHHWPPRQGHASFLISQLLTSSWASKSLPYLNWTRLFHIEKGSTMAMRTPPVHFHRHT